LKNVNWSAVIRDAIEHRIRLEERMPNRDWDKVKKANKVAEKIFQEMHKKYGHLNFDSTETIRHWRAKRYGRTQSQ